MRSKKVWRHYCDHCNKGSLSKKSMQSHEAHCTKNPDRQCGLCAMVGSNHAPIESLIKAAESGLVSELREAADGCPACMLAGIRQMPKDPMDAAGGHFADFDYKKESAEFWREANDSKNEAQRYYL